MKSEEMFQFGGFQIDVLARTLRREEEIVTLNRRAFDVLLYLVKNPGRVLTRDELLKNVWPETFVTDQGESHAQVAAAEVNGPPSGDTNGRRSDAWVGFSEGELESEPALPAIFDIAQSYRGQNSRTELLSAIS